jgi:hypothetical protein
MASTLSREQLAPRKLWWIGPVTIVIAIIINLVIRSIAVAFLGVPETFSYFQPVAIISSTIIFLLLALLAFVIVIRTARNPIRFYRILALIFLLISLLTPIMALTGLMPTPGMNLSIFWTMIAMHVVSAAITIGLFTTLVRA